MATYWDKAVAATEQQAGQTIATAWEAAINTGTTAVGQVAGAAGINLPPAGGKAGVPVSPVGNPEQTPPAKAASLWSAPWSRPLLIIGLLIGVPWLLSKLGRKRVR